MNPYTALAILFAALFSYLAVAHYSKSQSEVACFAVADTPAKLAICKGASYKEQQ
jgi:hypothetical protein